MKKTILAVFLGGLGLVLGLGILLLYLTRPASVFLAKAPPHGVTFVLQFDPPAEGSETNLVAELKEVIRRRFEKIGAQLFWETRSSNTFRVSVPITGGDDVDLIGKFICSPGKLELRLVHPESDELVLERIREPGYELLPSPHKSRSGQDVSAFLVKIKPELTGKSISRTFLGRDTLGRPEIIFSLDAQGTAIFAGVTASNVGRQIAIVLDGKVQSAPIIRDQILGGDVQIVGAYTDREASELAEALNSPLPAPIQIIDTRRY